MISFERAPFCIIVGISMDYGRCGLYIGGSGDTSTRILKPQYDQKYIAKRIFTFRAAKKSPFGNIITSLRECGIYPDGLASNFKATENPDNKYYTSLLCSELSKILTIIRLCVAGMTVCNIDGEIKSIYDEIAITDEEFHTIKQQCESNQISLAGSSCYVISSDAINTLSL